MPRCLKPSPCQPSPCLLLLLHLRLLLLLLLLRRNTTPRVPFENAPRQFELRPELLMNGLLLCYCLFTLLASLLVPVPRDGRQLLEELFCWLTMRHVCRQQADPMPCAKATAPIVVARLLDVVRPLVDPMWATTTEPPSGNSGTCCRALNSKIFGRCRRLA